MKLPTLILLLLLRKCSSRTPPQCPTQCVCFYMDDPEERREFQAAESTMAPDPEGTRSVLVKCIDSFGPSDSDRVPRKLPPNTKVVEWHGSSSRNVAFEDFFNDSSWHSVNELSLTFNTKIILVNSFEGVENVDSLSIHSKTLHTIERGAFKRLLNLTRLDLSYCELLSFVELSSAAQHLAPGFEVFRGDGMGTKLSPWSLDDAFLSGFRGTRLKEFHVPNTNLGLLTANPNSSIPHLTVLNFSGDNFLLFGFQMYALNLRVLDLSRVTFPSGWFLHDPETEGPERTPIGTELLFLSDSLVPKLQEVSISGANFGGASITVKNRYANVGLKNLKRIDLSNVGFKVYDIQIRGPSALSEIDVSNNRIEVLTPDCFNNHRFLARVNLSHNWLYKMEMTEDFSRLFSSNYLLTDIDISYNHLTHLPPAMLSNNTFLKYLHLQGNSLHTISLVVSHIQSLQTVDLSDNELKKVGELADEILALSRWQADNNRGIVQLKLSANPFLCPNCSEMPTLFDKIEHLVVDRNNVTCVRAEFPHKVVYPQTMRCPPPSNVPYYMYVVPVTVICILSISSLAGLKFYRYRKRKILLASLREAAIPARYLAFVSYCSTDADFVLESFVPEIENRLGTKLGKTDRDFVLVDDRHFVLGEHITRNVINAVCSSHVSLFVISESYLRSRWCDFESEVVQLEGKPVILVFLNKVSVKKSKWLQKLMRRWPYIQYPGISGEQGFQDDSNTQKEQFFCKLTNDLLKFWTSIDSSEDGPGKSSIHARGDSNTELSEIRTPQR